MNTWVKFPHHTRAGNSFSLRIVVVYMYYYFTQKKICIRRDSALILFTYAYPNFQSSQRDGWIMALLTTSTASSTTMTTIGAAATKPDRVYTVVTIQHLVLSIITNPAPPPPPRLLSRYDMASTAGKAIDNDENIYAVTYM